MAAGCLKPGQARQEDSSTTRNTPVKKTPVKPGENNESKHMVPVHHGCSPGTASGACLIASSRAASAAPEKPHSGACMIFTVAAGMSYLWLMMTAGAETCLLSAFKQLSGLYWSGEGCFTRWLCRQVKRGRHL